MKTWAGYGSGQQGAACVTPILVAQVEYEAEMPDGTKLKMHSGCHGLWMAERMRQGWASPSRRDRPGSD